MDVIEAIETRHSVRTFHDKEISEAEFSKLGTLCENVTCPFEGKAKIFLKRFKTKGSERPGTYGVISGCSSYFIVASAWDTLSLLSAGFKMESIVLAATAMGLGTCWLGGTFRNSDFDVPGLPPDMEVIAIVAVGYPAGRKRLLERFTGMMAKSRTRRPFGSLFFRDDFSHPLSETDSYAPALQMMRLAPSSLNSQPWRAVVKAGEISFFSLDNKRMHLLDCGIGLQHFAAAIENEDRNGRFEVLSPAPGDGEAFYLISFIPESSEL